MPLYTRKIGKTFFPLKIDSHPSRPPSSLPACLFPNPIPVLPLSVVSPRKLSFSSSSLLLSLSPLPTLISAVGNHEAFQVVGNRTHDRYLFALEVDVRDARLHEGHAAARKQFAKGRRNLVKLCVPDFIKKAIARRARSGIWAGLTDGRGGEVVCLNLIFWVRFALVSSKSKKIGGIWFESSEFLIRSL